MLGDEVYTRIAPSSINGVGVFAIRTIPKGVCPFMSELQTRWKRINIADILDEDVRTLAKVLLVPDENGDVDYPVGGLNYLSVDFYINQSDTPNVTWNDEGGLFITLRKIKAGEELTINYKDIGHTIV